MFKEAKSLVKWRCRTRPFQPNYFSNFTSQAMYSPRSAGNFCAISRAALFDAGEYTGRLALRLGGTGVDRTIDGELMV